ncbi:MAG: cytochrome c oxidase subunit II [Gammaproteobacteria bacterium]
MAALSTAAHAESTEAPGSGWGLLNMTQGVTDISRKIYSLHMLILWVCVIIGVVVFGVMIWSLIKFRKSQGSVADTTMVHNTKVEIVWTVIPVAILVAMAVPAANTLVQLEDTRNTELTIKVTGYQWGWQYDYLDNGVVFFSRLERHADAARRLASGEDVTKIKDYLRDVDNPLIVPADTKVRLLVTATDVIHSWWVPAFGLKKDAIPGYVNEMWFKVDPDKTGIYRGQCVELCGRDHGFMPIVVKVETKEAFDTWLKETAASQKQAAAPPPPAAATLATASTPAG